MAENNELASRFDPSERDAPRIDAAGFDPSKFDPVALARELLRSVPAGALATLGEDGHPFVSLVTVAADADGSPLLLLSRLATHTANLARDGRASLLLARGGKGDPLAHPRLTLVGQVHPTNDPGAGPRFLERHPKAELYAGFADFGFYRMQLERAHLNGGFARAATLAADQLLGAAAPLPGSSRG